MSPKVTIPLTIYAMERPHDRAAVLRIVREALQRLGCPSTELTLSTAQSIIDIYNRDGEAVLTRLPADPDCDTLRLVAQVTAWLAQEHGIFITKDDPERARRLFRDRKRDRGLTAAGATPEQVFQQNAPGAPVKPPAESTKATGQEAPGTSAALALALLVMSDGNPLTAAAYTSILGRASGDTETWQSVQDAIVAVFPWCKEALDADGLGL